MLLRTEIPTPPYWWIPVYCEVKVHISRQKHSRTQSGPNIEISGSQPRSWRPPSPACFVWLPYQTHLIQVLWSLWMSWWVESGVFDEGDIQNMHGWGARNLAGNHWSRLTKVSGVDQPTASQILCIETPDKKALEATIPLVGWALTPER